MSSTEISKSLLKNNAARLDQLLALSYQHSAVSLSLSLSSNFW
jgi:hypothetical protein